MPYGPKVIEHFTRPKNVGEMKGADGVGKASNDTDGDVVVIYIKVEGDRIVDVSFQTFGCAAAIASSSMFTEMIKGKTVEEALKVSKQMVADAFDEGMPSNKVECSVIAPDAFKEAVADYLQKRIH
ncbi:MAG: iron-sulfur cluster assembly scaffold protein [Methanomassiliicoccales archaeon]|jgi:nitrogen fixation NifU-like protein|nr:iron-sulfur cluster assembly scaffold protein [Methanomassiliicoccales archaeon]